jgi:hypothetical protein
VSTSLKFLVLLLPLALCFTTPALAVSDPDTDPSTDYCTQRSEACLTSCSQYDIKLWGLSFPSPRTTLCITECSVAYVGCLMLRFHAGV